MESKSKDNKRVYVYSGADDSRKRAALDELIHELIDPDSMDFDLETLHGPDLTADRLILASSMAPFSSKRRLVVVTQANMIPTAEQQSIAKRLKDVPETSCIVFVIYAPRVQDGKPKKKSELHAELQDAIGQVGKIVNFPLMKADPAAGFVRDLIKRGGKTITMTAAAAVVRRSGTDSGVLTTEVEKLLSFIGDKSSVTDADVEQVTTQTLEEKIFNLMDAVGSKNPRLAVQYLKPMFSSGSKAQSAALRILSMLAQHFRGIWQARILIDAGYTFQKANQAPEEIKALLPEESSILKLENWRMKKYFDQARNFSLDKLAECFERILAVDLAIKGVDGAAGDPALAVEMLVIELAAPTQKSSKGRAFAPSP